MKADRGAARGRQVGRRVMAAAAATLTPVTLELGGKDAFIVCDDADLGQAVPTALRGAFQSCGQNCAGAERFIVHVRPSLPPLPLAAACARAAGRPASAARFVASAVHCRTHDARMVAVR
jgi:acyl-CoA reductase-like NAD-dependent aldehyde dehydrogenase